MNTFKPPVSILEEDYSYKEIVELDSNTIEYKYVAFKFGETFKGRDKLSLTIK